jgi:homoserine dehydrogenase
MSEYPEQVVTVGMLGLGVVGSGVATLLSEHTDELATRIGAPVRLGPVAVRDASLPRPVEGVRLTTDPREVIDDPDVTIVVEVMGGIDPARELISHALSAGKSVVTANKELIAAHGAELLDLARSKGVRLEFEAAVAGGIPIIKPMRESLAGDRVNKVLGILNGTTNYILTRMSEDQMSFDDALAEAQRLGYAEADPTADIDGHDAAAKAAILASLAFDTVVVGDDVYREGIRGVNRTDIAYAKRLGYVVKLLGIAERVEDQIGVRVHPALVPAAHPLASVRESFNAVFIEADAVGELMFYGPGAGSRPTASAVVGDLVTAARARLANERPTPPMGSGPRAIRSFDDVRVQYCILLDVADESGVLAAVASVFGEYAVSIKTVLQEGRGEVAQLLLITHAAREGDVRATLDALRSLPTVRDVASVIRVEGGEV